MGQRDIPGADLTTSVYTTVSVYDVEGEVQVRGTSDGAAYLNCGSVTMVFVEDLEELALLRDKIDEFLGETLVREDENHDNR